MTTPYWNPVHETLDRAALEALQLRRLQRLVQTAGAAPFHERRLRAGVHSGAVRSLDDLRRIPFMTREDWMREQQSAPPYGRLLTGPAALATRRHTTSGTSGDMPLRALDSAADWEWIAELWCYGLWGFGVRPADRVVIAFGYGEFIGFWGLHGAAEKIGCLTLPTGGMSTERRLQQIWDTDATVVCSTPTYALRLAQRAEQLGRPLASSTVRRVILSGEPAGSIPETKRLIERQWGARAGDTAGMTEVGTIVTFECEHQPGGTHIIEDQFIEEVIDPESCEPVPYGELGERVVTSFGRSLLPLLRYRTSDLVVRVPSTTCSCGRTFDIYDGGIRGRIDDMKLVRGTNVFPRAVEEIVRRYPVIEEFQIRLFTEDGIRDEIEVLFEAPSLKRDATRSFEQHLAHALRASCGGLRFGARRVSDGVLPRFELKARRVVDERVVKGTES